MIQRNNTVHKQPTPTYHQSYLYFAMCWLHHNDLAQFYFKASKNLLNLKIKILISVGITHHTLKYAFRADDYVCKKKNNPNPELFICPIQLYQSITHDVAVWENWKTIGVKANGSKASQMADMRSVISHVAPRSFFNILLLYRGKNLHASWKILSVLH